MLKKQIPKNLLSNYSVTGINLLLGLLIIPFLIGKLGKEAFGLIILAESIIGFLEIATIGIRMSLARHATFSFSQGKQDDFLQYLSTGRIALFGLAALILAVGLTLSYNISRVFQVPPDYIMQAAFLFAMITVSCAITTVNLAYWAVLYVQQRVDLLNIASSCGMLFRALAIFLLFSILPARHVNLVTYGLIYLAMTSIREFLVYLWQAKLMPGLKLGRKHFRLEKVKEMVAFGFYSTVSYTSTIFNDQAANVIVNIFWGPAFNAVYGIGLKFPLIMKRLFNESTWVLVPTFTHLVAKKDDFRLETLIFMYTKLMSLVTIPLCLFLIFFAKPIILLWVGKEFTEAIIILQIYMFSLLAVLPFCVGVCVTNAYAKIKIPSFVDLGVALANVILCVILGKVFSLGLVGIALAAAIPNFLGMTLFLPYYTCKISGLSAKRYMLQTFIIPLAWAAIAFGVWYFSFVSLYAKFGFSWSFGLSASALSVLTVVLYALGAARYLLNRNENGYLNEMLRGLLRKIRRNRVPVDTNAL